MGDAQLVTLHMFYNVFYTDNGNFLVYKAHINLASAFLAVAINAGRSDSHSVVDLEQHTLFCGALPWREALVAKQDRFQQQPTSRWMYFRASSYSFGDPISRHILGCNYEWVSHI